MLNVLLSSAGRRVELLRCIRSTLGELGIGGRLVAADASPLTSAGWLADSLELVPRLSDDGFVGALLRIVERHQIGLLIPTIDTELPVLAAAASELRDAGSDLLLSGPETISIGRDKRTTHRFLTDAGLPRPDQWSASEALAEANGLPYPVIAKPALGSSSIGVRVVEDASALASALATDDYIVQSLAAGEEFTVDVWVDLEGDVRSVVPRRRIEVRAGEVSKGVTERHTDVIDVAAAVARALPDAYGPLTIQMFATSDAVEVIEINPRFGGGYPLSWEAGARTTRWAVQDALGLRSAPRSFTWRDGLVMLRHDASVFVDEADVSP